MVGRLEELITARTKRILDGAEAKGDVEFVSDIAYHFQ